MSHLRDKEPFDSHCYMHCTQHLRQAPRNDGLSMDYSSDLKPRVWLLKISTFSTHKFVPNIVVQAMML